MKIKFYFHFVVVATALCFSSLSWGWNRYHYCNETRMDSRCFGGFHDGLARVPAGDINDERSTFGFINKSGEMAIEPRFRYAEDFVGGSAVVVDDAKNWGAINTEGEWLVPPVYDYLYEFNLSDLAAADLDGMPIIVDRSGEVVYTPSSEYHITSSSKLDGFSAGLVRTPTVWDNETGASIILPENTVDVALDDHLENSLFVKVRGKGWGVYDIAGEWVVPPEILNTSNLPLTDGRTLVINRDGRRYFQTLVGDGRNTKSDTNSDTRRDTKSYSSVRLIVPGVWFASQSNGDEFIVDDSGEEVIKLEGLQYARDLGANGKAVLLFEDDTAIVDENADLTFLGVSGDYHHLGNGDVLWILRRDDEFPSLYYGEISGVFDLSGVPIFDEEKLQQLKAFHASAFTMDETVETYEEWPLAALKRYTDTGPQLLVVYRSGDIIGNRDWRYFVDVDDLTPPIRVETDNERVGAIGVGGDWVIDPEYAEIAEFRGPYTLADISKYSSTVAVLDRAGSKYSVPWSVLSGAEAVDGKLLIYSTEGEDGGKRVGLWDIEENRKIGEPIFSEIGRFNEGYASAKPLHNADGSLEGIIDSNAQWVVEPVEGDFSESSLLDPGVYCLTLYDPPDLEVGRYHKEISGYRVFSVDAGGPISQKLRESPKRVAEGRYLIEPASGGVRLIDRHGHELVANDYPTRIVGAGRNFSFADYYIRYGYLDNEMNWTIAPEYSSSLDFISRLDVAKVESERQGFSKFIDMNGDAIFVERPSAKPVAGGEIYVSANRGVADIFDRDGSLIASLKGISSVGPLFEGRMVFMKRIDGDYKFGMIDESGEIVVEPIYTSLGPLRDGLSGFAMSDSPSDLYGFIDGNGNVKIEPFADIRHSFSEGLALVSIPGSAYRYINTEGSDMIYIGWKCGIFSVFSAESGGEMTWPSPDIIEEACERESSENSGLIPGDA